MDYPKVTLQEVEAAIIKEDYTVLQDGRTTICLLTLDNGFTVRGESSCVHPGNFVKELGEEAAKKKAVDLVWAYLGFRLAEKLHHISQNQDWYQRLILERDELKARHAVLKNALTGMDLARMRAKVGDEHFNLLCLQLQQMGGYLDTLNQRIEISAPDATRH